MDVKTGSKSWGYSKRPRNWEKIMHQDLPEVEEEIEEMEEMEEIPEAPEVEEITLNIEARIDRGRESEASIEKPEITPRIEKPKITARVSKPVPRPLVDQVLPASLLDPALLDSSFSHI